MKTTNVTLSLPDTLLRRFRVHAAEQNRSMSSLMTEAIQEKLNETGPERAGRRLIELMESGPDLGLKGRIRWTRSEIHER